MRCNLSHKSMTGFSSLGDAEFQIYKKKDIQVFIFVATLSLYIVE